MQNSSPGRAISSEAAPLRVLVVCEHASAKFGGEAVLPLHYFRILRRRGIDARLLAHARTRQELLELLPAETDRMHFLADTRLNRLMWHLGRVLPAQIAYFTVGYISRLGTQLAARRLARRLISQHRIDVVHQPIPVSPREPSLLYDMGAPVIIGPMNGNMSFPPAFGGHGQSRTSERIVRLGRMASSVLHRLMPGKLRAAALLVANARTQAALPSGASGEVTLLVENGVDLETWFPESRAAAQSERPTRFFFIGRLVDWKAVDLLLLAVARLPAPSAVTLDIVGDGPMRQALEALATELLPRENVRFHGWKNQAECARMLRDADALVLPSLYECGGAVVLEAMATGLPVIATDWGGPADYLDATCGILVAPSSRDALVTGLADAMQRLHQSPAMRVAMGQAGRRKVEREYDWNAKVERMLEIYRRAAGARQLRVN